MTSVLSLILMCGLSFSGKSTVARQLGDALGATVLSLDAINAERGLYGGQGIPLEEWATTNRIADERVRDLLAAGRDVIVDDTGSPRFIRDGWRETARAQGAAFSLVWVQIDPELQRERVLVNRANKDRHDVIDEILSEHIASFEPPVAEDAITIDARAALDPREVARLVAEIREASLGRRS